MNKRKLVKWFLNWTHEWNHEIHEEIESRIRAEHYGNKTPNPDANAEDELRKDLAELKKMRTFYYGRMTVTATLMIGIFAALFGAAAAIASVTALFHSGSGSGSQTQGSTFLSILTPIVVALVAAWFAAFVAEDYKRFRDGKSLAAALYGELQGHLEGFSFALPGLKELRRGIGMGQPLKYMPPFERPTDPVYNSGVGTLGLLGPEVARDVAYTYQNIHAFRNSYFTLTNNYKDMELAAMGGMLDGLIMSATNAEARGKKALEQLDKLAREKYRIPRWP